MAVVLFDFAAIDVHRVVVDGDFSGASRLVRRSCLVCHTVLDKLLTKASLGTSVEMLFAGYPRETLRIVVGVRHVIGEVIGSSSIEHGELRGVNLGLESTNGVHSSKALTIR